jgi:hypothetical protein
MLNLGPVLFPKKEETVEQVEKTEAPRSPFKLQKALKSTDSPNKTTYRVMTSLPQAEFVNSLWELESTLGNKIADCLNDAYSHVTQRGAHGQGRVQFFHHNAATALYESYEEFLIKGKNHGIKSAAILNAVGKTLALVEAKLASTRSFPEGQRDILENAQAELLGHKKAIIKAIKALPESTKEHLKKYQNLDASALTEPHLSPTKVERVKKLHSSPKAITPKKLSRRDQLSQMALQATSPLDLNAAKALLEDAVRPKPPVAIISENVTPRLVPAILKKQALELKKKFRDVLTGSETFGALSSDDKESVKDNLPAPKTVTFLLNVKRKLATAPIAAGKTPSTPTSPTKKTLQI